MILFLGNRALVGKFLVCAPTLRRNLMDTLPWPVLLMPSDLNGYFSVLLNHQLLPTNVQYMKKMHT